MYVTNVIGNNNGMGGTVTVLSPADNVLNPGILVGSGQTEGVAVSPVTGDVYVVNPGAAPR